MAKDDPNLSVTVKNNTFTPSIIFCEEIIKLSRLYQPNIYTDLIEDKQFDLTDSITDEEGCKLFNELLAVNKPEESIAGSYDFKLNSNVSIITIGIGDLNNLDSIGSQVDI